MKTNSASAFSLLLGALALVGAGCFGSTQSNVNADLDVDAAMEADGTSETDGMEVDGTVEVNGDVMVDDTLDTDLGMDVDASAKVFVVGGQNFEFDTKEIRVKQGDTVTIKFTATSGFHDWVVDEFDAATAQVRDGASSEVTFVADKAGTFEYYCSVGRHREMGMVGKLIVE